MTVDRRWTLMLVPPGAGGSRSVRVSVRVFRWLAAVGSIAVVAGAVFAYSTVTKALDLSTLDRLERTNRLLAQEIDVTRGQIQQISQTLDTIMTQDREVRLLAGLEPRDTDVQLAGIGGPVGEWTERDHLLSEGLVGRSTMDMRLDIGTLLRRARLYATSYEDALDSIQLNHDRLTHTPSIMPTQGFLSSGFARLRVHPIFGEPRAHEGIDIAAPMAAPILATARGTVVAVSEQPGYGRIVTLDHGYGLVTRYAHASKILVLRGQHVERGDEIALVGKSGIVTAPHLHYEVLLNGRQIDPQTFIFPESIVD